MAEEEAAAPAPEKRPVSGYLAGGYTEAGGNNEIANININTNITAESGRWKNITDLSLLRSWVYKNLVDDNLQATNRLEYRVEESPWIGFWDLYYFKNTFQGYDYRRATGLGVGYQLVETKAHNVRVNAGYYTSEDRRSFEFPGLSRLRPRNVYALEENTSHQLTDYLNVGQGMSYWQNPEDSKDYTFFYAVKARFAITPVLSIVFKYMGRHEHLPIAPIGVKTDDTIFSSQLMVGF